MRPYWTIWIINDVFQSGQVNKLVGVRVDQGRSTGWTGKKKKVVEDETEFLLHFVRKERERKSQRQLSDRATGSLLSSRGSRDECA